LFLIFNLFFFLFYLDSAEPSGASVSALNLLRLASYVSESEAASFTDRAEKTLATYKNYFERAPTAVS
jgi:uncharacterized protein YyaL (SSP411 family)